MHTHTCRFFFFFKQIITAVQYDENMMQYATKPLKEHTVGKTHFLNLFKTFQTTRVIFMNGGVCYLSELARVILKLVEL